MTHVASTVH